MEEPQMRLALLQDRSPAGDADAALRAVERGARGAGASGAAMLVCPEVFLPGYNSDRIPAAAQPRGGPWHERLSEIARDAKCGITVGYAERDGAAVFNAAVAVDARGAEVAHYRKVQLYGAREKTLFEPGTRYCTFDLDGVPAALLICYDVEFAPHIAALHERGVRLILVPTANMAPFVHVGRHTVPAMAANHAVAIVYANYAGSENALCYLGESSIVAADGTILAQAERMPALLIADCPIASDTALLSQQAVEYRRIEAG